MSPPRDTGSPGYARQVLVAGRSVASLAAAALLDQAGLDPVLADGDRPPAPASVVPLWRRGLDVLDRVGLRRPVEAAGARIDTLHGARRWHADDTGSRPSLVAVRRGRVETMLVRHLDDRVHAVDRSVESLVPSAAGVRASFDHGVTETFDAAVTPLSHLLPDRSAPAATVPVWTFDWPDSVPAPTAATETWTACHVALTLPTGEGAGVVLVACDDRRGSKPLAREALAERFDPLVPRLGDALREIDPSNLRFGRVPHAVPRRRWRGAVCLVGPAARASVPGDCLGPALGLEDAWVVADALACGPDDAEAALGAYASRRRRRDAAVAAPAAAGASLDGPSEERTGVSRQLAAGRAVAFSHLVDGPLEGLAHRIPERL